MVGEGYTDANADVALTRLRRSLVLCHQLGLLTERQWGHVSGIAAEVGRLLGGWKKVAK
jgi:hypothetical protein